MSKSKAKKRKPFTIPDDVKLGFSTLISNEAVIKAGREMKGAKDIVPITLALVAVILAILPTFVSRNSVRGSSAVFSAPTANYEYGLSKFMNALVYEEDGTKRDNPIQVKINDNGILEISDNDLKALGNSGDVATGETWYTVNRSSTALPYFEVFFNTTDDRDSNFFNFIDSNQNPYTGGARTLIHGETVTFQSSYIAFGKESIRFRKRNDTLTFSGVTGDYIRLHNTNLTEFALSLDAKNLPYVSEDYAKEITTYFTDIMDKSFETLKNTSLWTYTGIFAGVDLGAILLFGLVMFLMTRGKKNPFRVYTFWETQKMAYWASFTPGLISLIGFALPNMSFIFFFMMYGLRMMWMSMKSLRPQA